MIQLTKESLRAIFPRAPQEVIDAFAAKQDLLTKAGINVTRARLAYFFANIEHECGGFTIPNLTENINYTASRMAQVWPNRFANAGTVQDKYGTGAGWQKKAFDDIYGNRMGNRPGTSDGSTYIGRGGPQWTGRDGYAALERLTGLPAVANPSVAGQLNKQPEVCTAFWTWKNLNRFADAGDFLGCVKAWNGGTNGLADRQHLMAGNDPIIKRLETVNMIEPAIPPKPGISGVTSRSPSGFDDPIPKPTVTPAKPPTVSTGAKAAGAGGGAVVVVAGAAAQQAGLSAPEILAIITGASLAVIAVIVIGYRFMKGHWPWTSIGKALPELSLPSLQSSVPSSELQLAVSRDQLALASAGLSAASQATPLPKSSASMRPRKQSAKPSQKTRARPKKSSSSKRSAARKSAGKPKSKSRS